MSTITSTNAMNTTITPITHSKSSKRPDGFTEKSWDQATYGAYIGLVNIVKGQATMEEYLTRNASLFNACGMPADETHFLSLLIAMAQDTSDKGEKVRKVKARATLSAFFNGGWMEKDSLRVSYNAGKDPSTKKYGSDSKKAKKTPEQTIKEYFGKMTPAEKAAFVANLMGEIAA